MRPGMGGPGCLAAKHPVRGQLARALHVLPWDGSLSAWYGKTTITTMDQVNLLRAIRISMSSPTPNSSLPNNNSFLYYCTQLQLLFTSLAIFAPSPYYTAVLHCRAGTLVPRSLRADNEGTSADHPLPESRMA